MKRKYKVGDIIQWVVNGFGINERYVITKVSEKHYSFYKQDNPSDTYNRYTAELAENNSNLYNPSKLEKAMK